MNMMDFGEASDFALRLVEGAPMDTRRLVFACDDLALLRAAASVIEPHEGPEMLQAWLTLRLTVLEKLHVVEQIRAGALPGPKRRTRTRAQPAQVSLLAAPPTPPAPPAPPVDLDVDGEADPGALVFSPAVDVDEGEVGPPAAPPPVRVVERPDPRPTLFLPVPAARQPPPFVALCLQEVLPIVLALLKSCWSDTTQRATLSRRAVFRDSSAQGRALQARWHRRAWAEGSPLETAVALLGLRVTWTPGEVCLSDAAPDG